MDANANNSGGKPPAEKIMVAPIETVRNMKPGQTTMQVCGWCKYAGSGMWSSGYMVRGKCNVIPLSVADKGLLPAVKLIDSDATIEKYTEINKMESKAIEDYKQLQATFMKMVKFITEAAPEAPDDYGNIDTLLWNTECVVVKNIKNKEFIKEIKARYRGWMKLFAERVEERDKLIDLIKAENNKNDTGVQ